MNQTGIHYFIMYIYLLTKFYIYSSPLQKLYIAKGILYDVGILSVNGFF